MHPAWRNIRIHPLFQDAAPDCCTVAAMADVDPEVHRCFHYLIPASVATDQTEK